MEPGTWNFCEQFLKDHLGKLQQGTPGSWCQDQQYGIISELKARLIVQLWMGNLFAKYFS